MNSSATPESLRAAAGNKQDLRAFGAELRRARESRQLSIEAAASACMLSDRQIVGLESADLRSFYSREYAQRAAKRYAAFMQVSSVPTLEVVPGDNRPPIRPGAARAVSFIQQRHRGRIRARNALSAVVLAMSAISYGIFTSMRDASPIQPQIECSRALPTDERRVRCQAPTAVQDFTDQPRAMSVSDDRHSG